MLDFGRPLPVSDVRLHLPGPALQFSAVLPLVDPACLLSLPLSVPIALTIGPSVELAAY